MTFPCPRFASDNIYHGYDSFSNVGYWNKLFVHHCMFHHFDQNRIRYGKPKTNRAAISKRDQKRSSCQATNGAINSPRVNKLLKASVVSLYFPISLSLNSTSFSSCFRPKHFLHSPCSCTYFPHYLHPTYRSFFRARFLNVCLIKANQGLKFYSTIVFASLCITLDYHFALKFWISE